MKDRKRTVMGGRYELMDRLGAGGMGTIYRALDQRLKREVAVKILKREDSAEALFFFHREARAVAALQDPGVVQVFDYSGPEESPPYIVMELVEGDDLRTLLHARHPMPEPVVVAIVERVAAALGRAHEADVIHRDIKPDNIMLSLRGRVVLTDFGLAKGYRDPKHLGSTVAQRVTQLFGTVEYVAPEQVLYEESSTASDVFSIGSMAYALCSGGSPFNVKPAIACMEKIANVDYVPLREVRPELTSELAGLVDHALQLEPNSRPTATELAESFRHLLLEHGYFDAGELLRAFANGEPLPSPSQELASGIRAELDTVAVTPRKRESLPGQPSAVSDDWDPPTDERPTLPAVNPKQRAAAVAASARAGGGEKVAERTGEAGKVTARSPWPMRAAAILPAVLILTVGSWLVLRDGSSGATADGISVEDLQPVRDTEPVVPSVGDVVAHPVSDPVSDPGPAASPEPAPKVGLAPTVGPVVASRDPDERPRRKRGRRRALADSTGAPVKRNDTPSATGRMPGESVKEPNRSPPPLPPAAPPPPLVKLQVVVNPWGEVYLDGKHLGTTPLPPIEAPAGQHTITVEHPVFGTQKKTVVFGRHKQLVIDLD